MLMGTRRPESSDDRSRDDQFAHRNNQHSGEYCARQESAFRLRCDTRSTLLASHSTSLPVRQRRPRTGSRVSQYLPAYSER
jgi:hypothetical protein